MFPHGTFGNMPQRLRHFPNCFSCVELPTGSQTQNSHKDRQLGAHMHTLAHVRPTTFGNVFMEHAGQNISAGNTLAEMPYHQGQQKQSHLPVTGAVRTPEDFCCWHSTFQHQRGCARAFAHRELAESEVTLTWRLSEFLGLLKSWEGPRAWRRWG